MKPYLSKLFIGIAFSYTVFFTTAAFAQLHGSYTINPGGSASSTNYKTFGSAVSDLSSGTRADGGTVNGPGVSAAVTFSVTSDTYSEQVVIPTTAGTITGASSTKTITFNGGTGNAANVILTSAGISSNYATLVFNACKYVTFENITIKNTASTKGFGVDFFISTLTNRNIHNKLEDCIIDVVNSRNNSNPNVGVTFSASLTTYNASSTVNDIAYDTVEGCSVHGGNLSMFLSYDTGVVVSNDSLLNSYKGGLYIIDSSVAFKIRNNYISSDSANSSDSTNIGIQITNGSTTSTSSDYAEISGNVIYYFTQVGLGINNSPGTSSEETNVFNNFIGGGIPSSPNMYGCVYTSSTTGYVNFWNNTLSFNTSGMNTSSACLQIAGTAGYLSIKDNIFSYTGSSSTDGECLHTGSSDLSNSSMDYNLFYNSVDASREETIGGTSYTSSTVIGGDGFNSNSQVNKPNFVNTSVSTPDLDITLQNPRGIALTEVTTDIHGTTRANPPCIGADEILSANAGSSVTVCSSAARIRIGGDPAATGAAPFIYSWTSSPSGFTSDSLNPLVDPTVTTTYTLTVTDTIRGTVDTATSTIVVNPTTINNAFTFRKDTVCTGANDTLTASLSGATAYTWVIPCGTTGTEISGGQSIIIVADTVGWYNVCLTVENSTCLSDPYCKEIYFKSCGDGPIRSRSLNDNIPSTTYSSIEVYPTIINDQTQLNVIIPTGDIAGIINVYNLLGQKITEFNLIPGKNQFSLSNVTSPGLYIYHVILNDNTTSEGKLMWMRY